MKHPLSKSVSIHQPNYIPWLGYFYKIYQTDYFVFLDDVQFSNEGMHNYHYIKTKNGLKRIKIPVTQTLGDKIKDVRIRNDLKWQEKHLNILRENYRKADHFDEVYSDFYGLINEYQENLSGLNIEIIKYICGRLGLKTLFVKSSDLKIPTVKVQKIIDICKALECDMYFSGTGAKEYQDEVSFMKHGIQLKYSDYKPFIYRQQFGNFQSNVTVLDFLMNYGYDWDVVIMHQANALVK